MAVSVAAVMRQINNYFEVGRMDGVFAISGNTLSPAPPTSWCCIKDSLTHDGVWEIADGNLQRVPDTSTDEQFTGRVWLLRPPADFLSLCEEISAYDDKNPVGAYTSESFGGYSYTRKGSTGANGSTSWLAVFEERLYPYRHMYTEVF